MPYELIHLAREVMPLVPTQVKETPASARLVYAALDANGPLEQEALIGETGITQRTVNSALAELRERALVEARQHPVDHRRRLYAVTDYGTGY